MADFIPGEGYRLDIIAADESVIVDSWAGQIKGDVVAVDGSIQVDVHSGKIYGPLIGNIEDIDGTVLYDSELAEFRTSIIGDVKDSYGNIVVDVDTGTVNATVVGNVIATDGNVLVDNVNKIIEAESIYGTFYGDLVGNVTSDSTIAGTFTGDFNGTGYGEFFGQFTGDTTGTLTGDVVGNVTGNVIGNLIGQILIDENTALTSPPTEKHNQWNWLGGLEHPINNPDDYCNGPIVVLGTERWQSSLRGHVQHYDGTPVVMLDVLGDSPFKAQFHGKLRGQVNDADDRIMVLGDNEATHLVSANGKIRIGYMAPGYEAEELELRSNQIITKTPIDNSRPTIAHFTSKGTWENPEAVAPFDIVYSNIVYSYNGDDYKSTGGFHFIIDPEAKVTPESPGIKTSFLITLSDGTARHKDNPIRLEYKYDGTLKIKTLHASGTTFSERDSMAPTEGMIIFNKNSKKFQGYNGTEWVDLG